MSDLRKRISALAKKFADSIEIVKNAEAQYDFVTTHSPEYVSGYKDAEADLRRVYLKPGQKVPKGRKTGTSKDGRAYYETMPRTKKEKSADHEGKFDPKNMHLTGGYLLSPDDMVKLQEHVNNLPLPDKCNPDQLKLLSIFAANTKDIEWAKQELIHCDNQLSGNKSQTAIKKIEAWKAVVKGAMDLWNPPKKVVKTQVVKKEPVKELPKPKKEENVEKSDPRDSGKFSIEHGEGKASLYFTKDGKKHLISSAEGKFKTTLTRRLNAEKQYYGSEPDALSDILSGKEKPKEIKNAVYTDKGEPKTKLIAPQKKDANYYNTLSRRELDREEGHIRSTIAGYEVLRDRAKTKSKKDELQAKIDSLTKQRDTLDPIHKQKIKDEEEEAKSGRQKINDWVTRTNEHTNKLGKYLKMASKHGVIPKDKLDEIESFIANIPGINKDVSKISPDEFKLNAMYYANKFTTKQLREKQDVINDQLKLAYKKYSDKHDEEGSRIYRHLDAMFDIVTEAVNYREFEFKKEPKQPKPKTPLNPSDKQLNLMKQLMQGKVEEHFGMDRWYYKNEFGEKEPFPQKDREALIAAGYIHKSGKSLTKEGKKLAMNYIVQQVDGGTSKSTPSKPVKSTYK